VKELSCFFLQVFGFMSKKVLISKNSTIFFSQFSVFAREEDGSEWFVTVR